MADPRPDNDIEQEQSQIQTDQKSNADTENDDQMSYPASEHETSEPEQRGDAWVTRRNPVEEVTSLISSMYLTDEDEGEEENMTLMDNRPSCLGVPPLPSLTNDLDALRERVASLENNFRDSVDSALNREDGVRAHVDDSLDALEQRMVSMMQQFEQRLVECLQRRDEKWKAEIQRLKRASPATVFTPLSAEGARARPQHSLPPSVQPLRMRTSQTQTVSDSASQTPTQLSRSAPPSLGAIQPPSSGSQSTPVRSSTAAMPSANAGPPPPDSTSLHTTFSQGAGTPMMFSKPVIRMDFPSFSGSREVAEVLKG
ncbi:uncharacterized protein LOC112153941 [Oryzias melastigma]|uniref:uncharacterized protein LOC112153941 n=1 Tax=Oryzias melastigma TaxID=30732 RepID=UPI000CF825E8|nr:uncharacterized protein LOC112153941 [Oryzias melastigma]